MYIIAKELTKPFTLLLLLPDLLYLFFFYCCTAHGFSGGSAVKNPSEMQEMLETHVPSLRREDPLEEEMATHSSILAWGIP